MREAEHTREQEKEMEGDELCHLKYQSLVMNVSQDIGQQDCEQVYELRDS